MGFSPPKPNPKIVAEQQSEAEQAKNQRIQLIQQQLGGEDELRAQIFGQRASGDQAVTGGGGENIGGGGYYGGGGGGLMGRPLDLQ